MKKLIIFLFIICSSFIVSGCSKSETPGNDFEDSSNNEDSNNEDSNNEDSNQEDSDEEDETPGEGVVKYLVTIINGETESFYEVVLGESFVYKNLETEVTNEYFLYWYYLDGTTEVKLEDDLKVTSNLIIYAKYLEHCTVTILYDGKQITLNFEVNNILMIEDLPVIDNEDFLYWCYISNGVEVKVENDITITNDLTIVAKYEGSTGTLPWV